MGKLSDKLAGFFGRLFPMSRNKTIKLNNEIRQTESEHFAQLCEMLGFLENSLNTCTDICRDNAEQIKLCRQSLRTLEDNQVKFGESTASKLKEIKLDIENLKKQNECIGEKLSNEISEKSAGISGELIGCISHHTEEILGCITDSDKRSSDSDKHIVELIENGISENNKHAGEIKAFNNSLSGDIKSLSDSVTAGFDKLVAQLWDDYELTRSDAAEIAEDIVDITVANRRLNELRGKIKNLGSVNLGAIEEYAEVSQRHEFLTGQLNDVNTSKTELEKLIEDLTENMKNMFTDSFERINANFKKIFTELFGGGQCELILTDPNNVLECGIEINVQPPGKVITNLMSLSGGEQALVAIAIYFAILKISPSPFCLLDEIEAALDDVNVSKYAQYLHHLTDKTQFITITHRRGTMEEADVLYGVTMQEKGVSKLLKMDVSETRQMKLE